MINSEVASFRVQTVKLYLAALNRGTKFIFQTLPRTLTIWLELGERPGVLEGIKTKPAEYARRRWELASPKRRNADMGLLLPQLERRRIARADPIFPTHESLHQGRCECEADPDVSR